MEATALIEAPQVPQQITANPPLRHRFTPQNAREAQQKATQAKLANKLAKELAKQLPPQLAQQAPRIIWVEKELDRIAKILTQTTDADAYRKFSASRGELFKEWQVLSGTPNPGSAPRGRKTPRIQIEPIQPLPSSNPGPASSPTDGGKV